MRFAAAVVLCLAVASHAYAQAPEADPADVASPEAIVAAVYASIERAPGETYDWSRFLSLYAPEAVLMPNPEQMGGEERTFSPQAYTERIDAIFESAGFIGSAQDRGFTEAEIHADIHRFGDIAHVFSTYEKFPWRDESQSYGRGINSFQLVYRSGRWWVVSGIWDEEVGAGPIPETYLGE